VIGWETCNRVPRYTLADLEGIVNERLYRCCGAPAESVPLEKLYRALVSFSRSAAAERAQISTFSRARIGLPRIEPVLTRF
jgi:hypothetical protein